METKRRRSASESSAASDVDDFTDAQVPALQDWQLLGVDGVDTAADAWAGCKKPCLGNEMSAESFLVHLDIIAKGMRESLQLHITKFPKEPGRKGVPGHIPAL